MKYPYKTVSAFFPDNLHEFEKAQSFAIKNWQDSIDNAFDSFSRLFKFSNDTFNTLNRFQNENIEMYFKGTMNSSTSKNNKTLEDNEIIDNDEVKTGIAVVTGGIGGIGTAICQQLALENSRIVATYIKPEKEIAERWVEERAQEGINADIVECDVSDFDSCKSAVGLIEEKYSRVDVLVYCAGITRDAMLRKMEPENWHAVLDTNLDSVYNMTRCVVEGMVDRSYGRIINISSVNGQKGQFGQTNYSSAKAGMIGFSRSLAIELADKGITVNSICPGYVGTRMVEAIPEEVREAIIATIPAGRLAKPEEIAHAVAFLALPESAYITGTEIGVNGGLWTG